MAKAIVLLSGGIDSATVAAIARRDGFEVCAITFDYGQRHAYEVGASVKVAKSLGILTHTICRVDLRAIGGSSLTSNMEVPKGRTVEEMAHGIPSTYVPARNTIFLSIALGWAEVMGASDIYIGANVSDYAGYPDCRPEYFKAFQHLAGLATKVGVDGGRKMRIHAPLSGMSKGEVVRLGKSLGVDYSATSSCYDPDEGGSPCGCCDSCQLRSFAFAEAGC